MRQIHLYEATNLCRILKLFFPLKDVSDIEDSIFLEDKIRENKKQQRGSPEFLERIIAIIPIFVKDMTLEQLMLTMELCHTRKIGSERLFYDFFYHYLEKKIDQFDIKMFIKAIDILAD